MNITIEKLRGLTQETDGGPLVPLYRVTVHHATCSQVREGSAAECFRALLRWQDRADQKGRNVQ